jgi:hypothetical protein
VTRPGRPALLRAVALAVGVLLLVAGELAVRLVAVFFEEVLVERGEWTE